MKLNASSALASLLLLWSTPLVRAQLAITEFMASNTSTLADENGSFSDWIEIENPTASPVNLLNWSLSDSANVWRFPEMTLGAKKRIVVFASGKDRRNPANNLHTNFSLSANGEPLRLSNPAGTVISEFAPNFPPQYQNVSYGYPVQSSSQTLLTNGTALRYHVPASSVLGTTWLDPLFNDASWTAGTNGLGYETGLTDSSEDFTYALTIAASNPLGYWRLNETSGTSAVNSGSLGAAVNGTIYGAAAFNTVGPRPVDYNGFESTNTSVGLTGGTSQIVVPDNAAFDLGGGAYAIEMWFYPTNVAARGDLFTYKGTGGDYGIHLSSQVAGKISLYHNGFIGTGGSVSNNIWYHLVVSRNVAGTTTVYLNGSPIITGTDTGTMNIANSLVFGSNHTGVPTSPSAVMAGRIDEAAIYNRELPLAEVASHYQRAVATPVQFASTAGATGLGAVGAWRFNETSGSVAANTGSLGAVGNGTIYGSSSFNAEGPRPPTFGGYESTNTSVSLPGSTSQIVIPDNAAFDYGTGAFAIEMWFYPTNAAVRGDLFTYKGVGGDFGIHLASQVAGKISVYHGAFIGTAGGTVVNNTWYHLIVTRNSSGALSAYLNGSLILSGTDTNSMTIGGDLIFGSNHTGVSTSPAITFPGRIDEAAIYGREIPVAEALTRYQNAVGMNPLFTTDVKAAMLGVNSSVYIRIPFNVTDVASIGRLALRMKYDDGFVAYVNGHEVLDANSPADPPWNAEATARHADSAAVVAQEFQFDDAIQWLQPGTNVLAIHAMNFSASNVDFLNVSELVATNITSLGTVATYLASPTPGSLNLSGTGTPGPVITLPAHTPAEPTDLQPVTVTARVQQTFAPIAAVTLNYRVMYGSVIQTPMLDDGANGDGAAGDGIYGATIPEAASAGGQMIRWYITANDNAAHSSRLPLFLDPLNSSEYLGTVVQSVTSNIPVWQWFAADTAAAKTTGGTRGAVFFGGNFYDNIYVRSRGASTSTGSQKFDFNPGEHCFINAEIGKVGEANLNAPGSDGSYIRPPLAFETFRLAGHPACHAFNVVLRANGAADRVGYYVEQVGDDFLDRNGLDQEGALYKFVQRGSGAPVFSDATGDGVEKKTRKTEGLADFQAFVAGLNQADVNARRAWFWDNVNAPSLLNLLALSRITQDADDVRKNFYLYRDTNGNGEWSIFPWDKDWTFGVTGDGPPHLYHPFFGDAAHAKQPTSGSPQWNKLWDFVFNDATLQPLAMRRLRTLMDQFLQPPGTTNGLFEQRANAWMTLLSPNVSTTVSNQLTGVLNFFPGRRNDLYNTYSVANGAVGNQIIPNAQATSFPVTIAGVDFNPASGNQEQEYIQLTNPGSFVADISGWKLAGAVSMTFDPGTVIPAGGSIYASPNSAAFRLRSSGSTGGQQLQVQDRFNGQLSARGETIQLLDPTNAIVTSFTYPGAPTAAQQQLRITELMFAPADPTVDESAGLPGVVASDFEFIELQNIGSTALELNGCHFEKGITFAFTAQTTLPAGGRILLVSNSTAFLLRYPGSTVAGQFTGNLDNGGETIQLVDGVGEVVLDFSYNDSWYPPADGGGYSLVVRQTNPDHATYDEPTHWAISGTTNGTPGATEPDFSNHYQGWRYDHWTTAELTAPGALINDTDDADGDGLDNFTEYCYGRDPRVSDNSSLAEPTKVNVAGTDYPAITFIRRHEALDVAWFADESSDLDQWEETLIQATVEPLAGGLERVTYRSASNAATRRFYRATGTKIP